MLRVVRDEMVNVVIVLPPASAQAAHIRCDEHCDGRVGREVMGNAHMTSIMDSECKLVPQAGERNSACDIPAVSKEVEK